MSVARFISKGLRGLRSLCVLILLTLAVTPTLDGVICAGEGAPASSVAIATPLDDATAGDFDHAICAHGHGHCATLIAPRLASAFVPPDPRGLDHRWPMQATVTSAPGERLERPPRA